MENNETLGGNTPNTDTQTNTPAMDYEQEYKKQLAEIERLKSSISKTNSENAEYKRKEQARMTDDEKNALELETLRKENANFKLEKSLLEQGYTTAETAKIIADGCSPKVFAEIMNDRIKAQEKNLKAESIVKSTPAPMIGENGGDNKESSLAERLAKNQTGNSSSDIKKFYNK